MSITLNILLLFSTYCTVVFISRQYEYLLRLCSLISEEEVSAAIKGLMIGKGCIPDD